MGKQYLIPKIEEIFEEAAGIDFADADNETTFFDLGLDSLFLTQVALALQNTFGVKISFRRLTEDLCTLDQLADHLAAELPPETLDALAPTSSVISPTEVATVDEPPLAAPGAAPAGHVGSNGSVEQLVAEQLRLMSVQLDLMSPGADLPPGITTTPTAAASAATTKAPSSATHRPAPPAPKKEGEQEAPAPFGAQARIDKKVDSDELTPAQREYIEQFTAKYVARTRKSKDYTQRHRSHMADPRVVTGFTPPLKELIYQVVVERSAGARLWDLDGNEYLDMLSGFGSCFLGYQPDFILEALKQQMKAGFEIGPQHPLAGEVARKICELTDSERAAFCNTGSEAVLGAMRIARTVTGRKTIAIFEGSYHGIFDEVIVRGTKKLRTIPAAPGIMPEGVKNVLVLPYGTAESLAIIKARAHELAAVMVEPVQSRRPDFQPREFLQELREVTTASGSCLIFDEVITGFRIAPGGAQAHFGVKADIASYGKIIGGGMPIGVIAGRSEWMAALDGGQWQFGDSSIPEAGVTYFAGTFCRHPLALAAANATLDYMKDQGADLQWQLNSLTDGLVHRLKQVFSETNAPLKLVHFASVMKLNFTENVPHGELLFALLRQKGIHILAGFPNFLNTAYRQGDVDLIVGAFREAIEELQAVGLLPGQARPEQSLEPITCPATEAQQELLAFMMMGEEASLAYNESLSLALRGALDSASLQAALNDVLRAHQALRMTFSRDGRTLKISPTLEIELPLLDLSAEAADAREAAYQAVIRRHVSTPFELAQAPLLRAELLRYGEQEHILVITAHHLVYDGWSAGLLLEDLGRCYSARVGAQAVMEQPDQFADYVNKQGNYLKSAAFEETERYWLDRFATLPSPLDLPTDYPRPRLRSYAASRIDFELDAELVRRLKAAGAGQGCSFVMTMMAAFKVLLYRWSGQSDLVVGLASADQMAAEMPRLMGHCVNLLPLRSQVGPEQSFVDYLKQLRTVMLDAIDHQRFTFGTLLKKLPLPRDPSRIPLVPVSFNIDIGLDSAVDFSGLDFEVASNPRVNETFELFVNAYGKGDQLVLEWTYKTDLFSAETIRRRFEEFEQLLTGIAENPQQRIGWLPMLSDGERSRIITKWNDTQIARDASPVYELIEAHAKQRPTATAVIGRDATLSYQDLDRRANQLAHYLRGKGVAKGDLVGVAVERSAQMVVCLLAVHKAGAAYLPVDPEYPKDRIHYVLEDAKAKALLCQAAYGDRLPELDATVVFVDDEREAVDACSAEPLRDVERDGQRLAYVIYTSGSTGKPKGVPVHQAALSNLVQSMLSAPGMVPDDVMVAVCSLAFDMSVNELFTPLAAGATCVVASRDDTTDDRALARLLDKHHATVMQATPVTWRMLVDGDWPGRKGLKAITGGEPLASDLAAELLSRVGSLWNGYGPTETTCYSTLAQIERADEVTIGRPIDNTVVYILDQRLQPVPVGVEGELFIGGAGVSAGYLGRPELTAERFLPNTIDDQRQGRIYRTGDVVRWLPDGRIDYRGRRDHQVKVRGYRIELEEIEAALGRHEAVGARAVIVREDRPGDKRIVAYFELERDRSVTGTELRRHLRAALPEYMVPQHFVELDALPQTPNGKIDRKALLADHPVAAPSAAAHAPPETAAEKLVAEVWGQALGVEQVGRTDNFFGLGGHSLLVMQALLELERRTGMRVSPREMVFQTLQQFAQSYESSVPEQAPSNGGQASTPGPDPITPPLLDEPDRSFSPFGLRKRLRRLIGR